MNIEETKIAVADIRPGDTLLVHFSDWLSKDQRAVVQQWVEDKFPHAEKVVILEGGVKISVARAGSDQMLEEIRDAVVQMSKQFNEVSAGGRAMLTEQG